MTSIQRATRNKVLLFWLKGQNINDLVTLYARHLDCPREEIQTDFVQPEDLDWIWNTFGEHIEAEFGDMLA